MWKVIKVLIMLLLMGCSDSEQLAAEIEALNHQALEQLRYAEEYRQSSIYDEAMTSEKKNQSQIAAAQGEEAVIIQKDLLVQEKALREEIRKIKLQLEKCLK